MFLSPNHPIPSTTTTAAAVVQPRHNFRLPSELLRELAHCMPASWFVQQVRVPTAVFGFVWQVKRHRHGIEQLGIPLGIYLAEARTTLAPAIKRKMAEGVRTRGHLNSWPSETVCNITVTMKKMAEGVRTRGHLNSWPSETVCNITVTMKMGRSVEYNMLAPAKIGVLFFVLRDATRAHSGTYTLAEAGGNCTGTFSVKINVLDKPSAPEGPLEVSHVQREGRMRLGWRAPADDGGTPIDHYAVERMDMDTATNRRWEPCGRCTEPGMTVQGLQPGHAYQFRVRAVNAEGESEPLMTNGPLVANNKKRKRRCTRKCV